MAPLRGGCHHRNPSVPVARAASARARSLPVHGAVISPPPEVLVRGAALAVTLALVTLVIGYSQRVQVAFLAHRVALSMAAGFWTLRHRVVQVAGSSFCWSWACPPTWSSVDRTRGGVRDLAAAAAILGAEARAGGAPLPARFRRSAGRHRQDVVPDSMAAVGYDQSARRRHSGVCTYPSSAAARGQGKPRQYSQNRRSHGGGE